MKKASSISALVLGSLLASIALPAFAEAPDSAAAASAHTKADFAKKHAMKKDGKRDPDPRAVFARMDTDKDGQISEAEFMAAAKARKEHRAAVIEQRKADRKDGKKRDAKAAD